MPKRKKILRTCLLLAGGLLALACTLAAALWVVGLREPQKLAQFQNFVASLGAGGWLLLLAIQYMQIVIAFIPGGPLQIVAGALCGPVGGAAICLLGTVLATLSVFFLVERFGRGLVLRLVGERDMSKYSFVHNETKLERLVLLLFFIPGTPKDALTYVFALTPIAPSRFLLLSTLARMPALLTSVFAGNSITHGQWGQALVFFSLTTLVAFSGLLLHTRILRAHKKR